MSKPIPITPQTKVAELLDAYPWLEAKLLSAVPSFEKLNNPVLRKTVARVATLENAAMMAGVPVEKLIAALRKFVGQADTPETAEAGAKPEAESPAVERPDWVVHAKVTHSLDADEFLTRGEHPLNRVLGLARELAEGQALRLVSSFRPAPLIEKLEQAGYCLWCGQTTPGKFETVVGAKKAP